jgi:ATP-dependent helicase/nuclease subunit B
VLQRFHQHEPEAVQADAARSVQRLDHWAQQVQAELGLDAAAFLPFWASWPPMRDAYLAWLHDHRAQGARVWRLEQPWHDDLDEGVQVHGVLDRVDRSEAAGHTRLWVMDYKTERASAARRRARSGTEDTQLAFYAALAQQAQPQAQIEAAYLCVGEARPDDRDGGTRWEVHPEVISDAQAVMQGVLGDWQALRAGAAMPALGESPACDHCAARGLCRRDLWGAGA